MLGVGVAESLTTTVRLNARKAELGTVIVTGLPVACVLKGAVLVLLNCHW